MAASTPVTSAIPAPIHDAMQSAWESLETFQMALEDKEVRPEPFQRLNEVQRIGNAILRIHSDTRELGDDGAKVASMLESRRLYEAHKAIMKRAEATARQYRLLEEAMESLDFLKQYNHEYLYMGWLRKELWAICKKLDEIEVGLSKIPDQRIRDGHTILMEQYLKLRETRVTVTEGFHLTTTRFPEPLVERILSTASTLKEKNNFLQHVLKASAETGNVKGILWVKKNHQALGLTPLDLRWHLKKCVRRGFDEAFKALYAWMPPGHLKAEEKAELVASCIDMGYPTLLEMMQDLKFPVTANDRVEMAHLLVIQGRVEHYVSFPGWVSDAQYSCHGGDSNKKIREKGYTRFVGWVLRCIRRGDPIREIIDKSIDRRMHMAVECDLDYLDLYGSPTCLEITTKYSPSYEEAGAKVKQRNPSLPVWATVTINGEVIRLTKMEPDRWRHPVGNDREKVLDWVSEWCETHLRPFCEGKDLAARLALPIFGLSHMPPSCRGTPTILRALTDAFCLHQKRKPIPDHEINLWALTHTELIAFMKEFGRLDLPIYFLDEDFLETTDSAFPV